MGGNLCLAAEDSQTPGRDTGRLQEALKGLPEDAYEELRGSLDEWMKEFCGGTAFAFGDFKGYGAAPDGGEWDKEGSCWAQMEEAIGDGPSPVAAYYTTGSWATGKEGVDRVTAATTAALGRYAPGTDEHKPQEVAGYSASLVLGDRVVWDGSYGMKSRYEGRLGYNDPITNSTTMHWASVSKTLTCTCIMILVEEGKIKLDEKITTYLPYYKLKDERYKVLTVRSLLNHTSGTRDVGEDYEWTKPQYDDECLERWVKQQERDERYNTLDREPFNQWNYSNNGYDILGDIVAKASGQSFEAFAEQRIFQPLGMKNSTFLYKADQDATPHAGQPSEGPRGLHSAPQHHFLFPMGEQDYTYNRRHNPSGGLDSNVEDMSRYLRMHLNRGALDGQRILKDSTYDELWAPCIGVQVPAGTPYWLANLMGIDTDFQFGLGFFLQPHGRTGWKGSPDDAFTVRHGGDEAGTKAELYMLPNKTLGFCAVSNSDIFNYDGRDDNGWNTAPIVLVKKWFEKHLPEFAEGTTGEE